MFQKDAKLKQIKNKGQALIYQVTRDSWQVAGDIWQVVYDRWQMQSGVDWTFSQNFSSLDLTV